MNRRKAMSLVATDVTVGAYLLNSPLALSEVLSALDLPEIRGGIFPRQLKFTLTLFNPHARSLIDQTLWLYLPVKRTACQDLISVFDTSGSSDVISDNLGHQILKLSVKEFPPLAQRVVVVTMRLRLYDRPRPIVLNSPNEWLVGEMYTEIDDASIVALATRLKANDPIKTARNIYDWVSSNIAYAGYVADDLGATYALAERKGDCTEYAFLVVALARACKVPARMVGGYLIDRDAMPRPDEYHNWAELYWDGSWNIVDAQKMNWLEPCSNYVAFRYFRAQTLSPIGLAHRFKVHGEIKVSM